MDVLRAYSAGSDSDEDGEISETTTSNIPMLDLAPAVAFNPKLHSTVAIYDEKNREVKTNPKYDELYRPDVSFLMTKPQYHFLGWTCQSV
jgi:hypothetical protein